MDKLFPHCFSMTVSPQIEGGFSNNPLDKGGPTMWGITMPTLSAHRHGAEITVDDIRNLTLQEVEDIYRHDFWLKAGCDALPVGVDYVVFDAAVNCGVPQAVKWLQLEAGLVADGIFGARTIGGVAVCKPHDLTLGICQRRLRMNLDINSPTEEAFEKGWANRILRVLQTATRMIAETPNGV